MSFAYITGSDIVVWIIYVVFALLVIAFAIDWFFWWKGNRMKEESKEKCGVKDCENRGRYVHVIADGENLLLYRDNVLPGEKVPLCYNHWLMREHRGKE